MSATVDTFSERLGEAAERASSLVCVGLDVDISRFPAHLQRLPPKDAIVRFNAEIIEATSDFVCAYKPNLAFYFAYGIAGVEALLETRALVPVHIPVILDCKSGDVGSTTTAYARGYFDEWNFDAITVNAFLGEESLVPFFSYPGRGVIVVCKTSNPGGGEWQDAALGDASGKPLYLELAARIARWSEKYPASIGLVVGATYPEQLALVRERCPELPILLPGVGAQAGDLEASVTNGIAADGGKLMVSSSRAITYAGSGPDFAERARDAALTLRDEVNAIRSRRNGIPA